ncbi:MAG: ABC transporter ATP-binding protein [Spirochaetales bacterium]|nr:ABC transporter ATP-binding protein [Spirochaetales bacterium]
MISLNGVSKQFNAEHVLADFSLSFEKDKINVLVGPSGCGKTTLLRILSGIAKPDAGTVSNIPKTVSMVFQEARLIPWARVEENLLLACPRDLRRKPATQGMIRDLLVMTGLYEDRYKYPYQLSGGMRKRAALARGFVPDSGLVLLDEPLQAVDWAMKISLVNSFFTIWEHKPVTVVFVTHDIQEAALMGDVIHILGKNPMTVLSTIENQVKKSERHLYHDGILSIERNIFDTLMKQEPEA